MLSYVLRRFLYAVFVLFGVATVVFFIARLTGDPVAIMLPPDASAQQVEALRHSFGLDKPLVEQYGIYLLHLVQLNFGESLRYSEPVARLIAERLPATMQLAGASLLFSLIIAIPAGIVAAMKRGTAVEGGVLSFVLLGQSMPVFWVGILLILVFSVHLKWFPTGGIGGWRHLALPAIALGLHLMALVTRLLRSSMLEALGSDYIRTARAKGLYPRTVVAKHALRNSLLPVVTVVGLEIGALLGGSVVTETIFAWPGVGQLLIQAIYNRDFPLVQGAIILLAGVFVLVNLLVDLCYMIVDPRIQYK
ncbi:ABC transporter permease [Gordoniibacillus kamchatkensis]|uniref:ABC transporter permease n=1 Tax=Gordoniibacillus kamchatkensis TaxID=1590651 RepID=A0ABR5ACW4_9BACL|nr:ABC transporter permease [Paenibacillus sp. VKM B-2647]KIL38523.1 ABC transporter permease [Paenibacillus sp. VKM B-2647]